MLAGPALAQSATEKTGVNSLVGVAPKTEDFVLEAATSDMFEIESSKLAVERANAPIKTFAQQMITENPSDPGPNKLIWRTSPFSRLNEMAEAFSNSDKVSGAMFSMVPIGLAG